jgi:hypothetical protein
MLRADDIVSASTDPTKIPGSNSSCSCENDCRVSTSCANDIVSAFIQFTSEEAGFCIECANDIVGAYATDTKAPAFRGVLAQGVISYRNVLLYMLYRETTEMRHGRFHWRQPLLHDQAKYGPDETSEEQLLPVL